MDILVIRTLRRGRSAPEVPASTLPSSFLTRFTCEGPFSMFGPVEPTPSSLPPKASRALRRRVTGRCVDMLSVVRSGERVAMAVIDAGGGMFRKRRYQQSIPNLAR